MQDLARPTPAKAFMCRACTYRESPAPLSSDVLAHRTINAQSAPILQTYMRGAMVVELRRWGAWVCRARLVAHPYLGARGAAREV